MSSLEAQLSTSVHNIFEPLHLERLPYAAHLHSYHSRYGASHLGKHASMGFCGVLNRLYVAFQKVREGAFEGALHIIDEVVDLYLTDIVEAREALKHRLYRALELLQKSPLTYRLPSPKRDSLGYEAIFSIYEAIVFCDTSLKKPLMQLITASVMKVYIANVISKQLTMKSVGVSLTTNILWAGVVGDAFGVVSNPRIEGIPLSEWLMRPFRSAFRIAPSLYAVKPFRDAQASLNALFERMPIRGLVQALLCRHCLGEGHQINLCDIELTETADMSGYRAFNVALRGEFSARADDVSLMGERGIVHECALGWLATLKTRSPKGLLERLISREALSFDFLSTEPHCRARRPEIEAALIQLLRNNLMPFVQRERQAVMQYFADMAHFFEEKASTSLIFKMQGCLPYGCYLSADELSEQLNPYMMQLNRVHVYTKKQATLARGRRLALQHASHALICYRRIHHLSPVKTLQPKSALMLFFLIFVSKASSKIGPTLLLVLMSRLLPLAPLKCRTRMPLALRGS